MNVCILWTGLIIKKWQLIAVSVIIYCNSSIVLFPTLPSVNMIYYSAQQDRFYERITIYCNSMALLSHFASTQNYENYLINPTNSAKPDLLLSLHSSFTIHGIHLLSKNPILFLPFPLSL